MTAATHRNIFPNVLHEPIGQVEINKVTHQVMSHPSHSLFMGQLIGQLQSRLSSTGYFLPKLTTAQIAQLDPAKSDGAILIDSTTNELKVFLNGVLKTVTVT